MHVCVCMYMYVCICICMWVYVCICMYVCIVYTYVCIYMYMYLCIFMYECVCMYMYMYVCICCNRSADRGDLINQTVKNMSYGHRSFAIAGPSFWSSLPVDLRHSSSFTEFKSKL